MANTLYAHAFARKNDIKDLRLSLFDRVELHHIPSAQSTTTFRLLTVLPALAPVYLVFPFCICNAVCTLYPFPIMCLAKHDLVSLL